jgi:uncharacterized protein (TIGR02452 family)
VKRLREIADETMAIIESGGYQPTAGADIQLAEDVAMAVAGTRLYLPDDPLPAPGPAARSPVIEVTRETTLGAARRLGADVACLVFASAKNPGGGFRNGARAQEEDIARASALYACQTAAGEFYAFHRQQRDLRYSDQVIYSPAVPVFRDDDGTLLHRPHPVSFLTAAAPNLGAITSNQPGAAGSVPRVLRTRAARVLDVASAHGHRRLVLGAWGCGVFRNDPAVVATAFADALRDDRRFEQVVFAVYDRLPGTPAFAAFADVFRPWTTLSSSTSATATPGKAAWWTGSALGRALGRAGSRSALWSGSTAAPRRRTT